MSLRPITPQSPARAQWESDVCYAIECAAEVTTSDAQAIMEADPDGVDRLFSEAFAPAAAARELLGEEESAAPAEQSGLDILNAEGFKLLEVESDSTEAQPVAGVAENFLFVIRGRPDGSRWPAGTKLYADADVKVIRDERNLLRDQRDALANELSGMRAAHDNLNTENRNLRTELDDVKRANVHALASLGEAREQRDALRDSLGWIVAFCHEHPEWFGEGDNAEHEWLESAAALLGSL